MRTAPAIAAMACLSCLSAFLFSDPSAAVTPTISSGPGHTLAVDSTGKVFAWGSDSYGQLGVGRNMIRSAPTLVTGLPSIVSLSMKDHAIAADVNGNVWTWGDNSCGQLGPRDTQVTSKPGRVIGVGGIVQVAAGECHSVALKSDGTVLIWSGRIFTSADASGPGIYPVPGLTGIVQIATGANFLLARRADGTVFSIGRNTYGELGRGFLSTIEAAGQVVGLPAVTTIAASEGSSVALQADGTVWFWGYHDSGGGTPNATPVAMQGLGGPAIDVHASLSFPAAVRADGTVWRWGFNAFTTPSQVIGMTGIARVISSANTGATYGIAPSGQLFAAGSNSSGQLGQGDQLPHPGSVAVPGMTNIVTASSSVYSGSVVALMADGNVWFWGQDTTGQSGGAGTYSSSIPRTVALPVAAKDVAAGYSFSVALDTTGQVWGWGNNNGAIDSTQSPRSTPAPINGLAGFKAVAANEVSVVALRNDGKVWMTAPIPYTGQPQEIAGLSGITAIAASRGSVFVLRSDGTVLAFGGNYDGELGDGTTTPRFTPSPVLGIAGIVVAISAGGGGSSTAAAVTSDGRVWVWGRGPLGNGTDSASSTAVAVPGITDAAEVSVGQGRIIVRKQNGTLVGWGGYFGAGTGDGGSFPSYVPVAIPVSGSVQKIASSGFHSFAISSGGLVRGWGTPGTPFSTGFFAPQIGDGSYSNRPRPVIIFRADGEGTVDGNNWFLDLDPSSPEVIAPSEVPGALAYARVSGSDSILSLDATLKVRQADVGKTVGSYVLALVPPAFLDLVPRAAGSRSAKDFRAKSDEPVLVQLTPQGWSDVRGQLVAWTQGVASGLGNGVTILNGVPTTTIPGARFCVGYGESAAGMLSAGDLREVLLLPGSAATVSGVPCVLSGVYVDGPASSVAGTPVTFAASVVGADPTGTVGATGTVQFRDGFANLGGSVALVTQNAAVARASIGASSLATGLHSVSASYGGDAYNGAATSGVPLIHLVNPAASVATAVLAGPTSSEYGREVVFVANVSGNLPTGLVQFRDGASNLDAPVALIDGVAVLRITGMRDGVHSIRAAYGGDARNGAALSPVLSHQVVSVLGTSVSLSAGPSIPKVGTKVTLSANVAGNGPQGSVIFLRDGIAVSGAVPLVSGVSTFEMSTLVAGSHRFAATYSGDAANLTATSPVVTVRVFLDLDLEADFDGDGVSNGIEQVEGRNPLVKDNDIFASNRLFAMQQYRDFLGREGDAGGIDSWVTYLNGAGARSAVTEGFFGSPEFQGAGSPVVRLYFAYFLRIPDYAGLVFWINYFRMGQSLVEISNAFAGSQEFVDRYGALGNDQFVDLVYRNVLGRAADAGGKAFWLAQLNGSMTRGEMMIGFSQSAEYQSAIFSETYVTMMYVGMLRRAPDAGGFGFWVNYIDSGSSGQALIGGFIVAPEYRSRFLP